MTKKNAKKHGYAQEEIKRPISIFRFSLMSLLCLSFLYGFLQLGIWQVHRLSWKEKLIQQISTRMQLPLQEAPNIKHWPWLTLENSSYLPIRAHGRFLEGKNIFITTLADGQTGYWWMMPFVRDDGEIIFVNRGFIPMKNFMAQDFYDKNSFKEQTVAGLLHMTEKDSRFIRKNNPEKHIWYNRNISQMREYLQLDKAKVAPYFLDSFQDPSRTIPIGSLTNTNLPNNHLSYAITWFSLAFGMLIAFIFLIYDFLKRRPRQEIN